MKSLWRLRGQRAAEKLARWYDKMMATAKGDKSDSEPKEDILSEEKGEEKMGKGQCGGGGG